MNKAVPGTPLIPADFSEFGATAKQRGLAKKYLGLRKSGRQFQPVLCIGVQTFTFSYPGTRSDCNWHLWMMAKALEKLLEKNSDTVRTKAWVQYLREQKEKKTR